MRRLVFLLSLAILGCKAAAREAPPPPVPLPFTVEELREANPIGTILAFRVEQTGATPLVQSIRVARADDVFVVLETWTMDEDGRMVGTPVSTRKKWSELVEPLLPAGSTVVTDARCEVPAGTFDCWQYTVAAGDRTRRYYFAKELPSAPVLSVLEEGGRVTRQVALQSKTTPQS